jgi:hypothetical protein
MQDNFTDNENPKTALLILHFYNEEGEDEKEELHVARKFINHPTLDIEAVIIALEASVRDLREEYLDVKGDNNG